MSRKEDYSLETCGVPMQQALTEDECDRMRKYLYLIVKSGSVGTIKTINRLNKGKGKMNPTDDDLDRVKKLMAKGMKLIPAAREADVSYWSAIKNLGGFEVSKKERANCTAIQ